MNTHTPKTLIAATAAAIALLAPAAATARTYAKVGANHDRTVELVSTGQVGAPAVAAMLSADGERVIYKVFGGTDATAFGDAGFVAASRTSTGWKTSSAMPFPAAVGSSTASILEASPDLKHLLILGEPDITTVDDRRLFRYRPDSGALTGVHVFSASDAIGFGGTTSDDLDHLIADAGAPLVAEDPAPGGGLYDFGSGEPVLIGLLPGGAPAPCGVSQWEFVGSSTVNSASQNWVSGDGSRVFFHTRGAGDCDSDPENLYMRDGGRDGVTHLISGPPIAGPDMGARFSRATPDGSEVFYTTTTRLDLRDENSGTDVYRYTVGSGNSCLTCAVPDAQVEAPTFWTDPDLLTVGENGDRVYFTSSEALAPGATAGSRNLYVWRRSSPAEIDFVAPSGLLISSAASGATSVASRDGAVLIFASSRPELDALTGSGNGGFEQYYRYDDRTETLVCVSCPPGRAARMAPRIPLERPQMPGGTSAPSEAVLSADGRSFLFRSSEVLVPRDTNGAEDIYEWRDGNVGLITDGQTGNSNVAVFGVSADGRDVLFSAYADLAPGALDTTGQLYVARIGGGFPQPPVPAPCAGDGCQGSPSGRPGRARPASGGVGDERAGRRAVISMSRLTAGQRVVLARGGRMVVRVRVNRGGVVRASLGRDGGSASKRARGAGPVRLGLRLSGSARRRLSSRGRLAVSLTVRFGSDVRVRKINLRSSR